MKLIKGEVHKNLLASEIEVLKTLKNCDNIIEVYDIYNTKNNTYIITELCDGGDLSKLIANKRALPETHAIALMTQIINGYVNFHSRGIIHRDLKPANIFLRSNTVKIADFGFAMKCSDGKKYSSYNVGSPVYMPPEALNENKYSFKSDIWALGVIYYEMLTGKTPWRAKTEKELAKLMLSVPIKKLLPPSISQSSENFLLRTLTLDINERMSPEELQRFQLSSERSSNPSHLYSTEGTVFDGRNNSIRRNEMGKPAERQLDRHDTSLNKHSLTNQFQLKKATLLQSEEFKTNTMLKTAATISNKTEHFIANSNQQIPHVDNSLTQKDISLFQSKDASYDRKYLSKQLLSQIHLCRFLFKLILRIGEKLPPQTNQEL